MFRLILADEYLRSARWDQALAQFRAVQSENPRTANPWRDTLLTLLSRGNVAGARSLMDAHRSWAEGTVISPATSALVDAYVHRALGNDSAALDALRMASKFVPDARILVQLGDLYSGIGQQAEAMAAYRAAMMRPADSSTSAHAWGAMGRLTAQMGRPASAAFYWDQALKLDSSYFVTRNAEATAYQSSRKASGVSAKPVRLDSTRANNSSRPDSVSAVRKRP